MKKAFTLVEMLIVVVIIVTLMAIVYRLSSVASDSDKKSKTIVRIQRLENCLSGYYAAFGSYPPVSLHGTRDFTLQVDEHGIQEDGQGLDVYTAEENRAWRQVRAACLAQPVACNFPFPKGYREVIRELSDEMAQLASEEADGYEGLWSDGRGGSDSDKKSKFGAGFDDGNTGNGTGRFSGNADKADWRNIQLFRFGLMSYLLPRYLVMMTGSDAFYSGDFAQWSQNNVLPCDPFTGETFNGWDEMKEYGEHTDVKKDIARLANIPSQAVCARWMPNLAGTCQCNRGFTLFGVDIRGEGDTILRANNGNLEIYSPGKGYSDQYVLDGITVQDGWWNELYYYSPAPYQRYTLWSGGANGKTFPPWVSRAKLNGTQNKRVAEWTHDDIVHMSN